MSDFKKIVRIGTSKTHGGRSYSIFCQIKFESGRLSIMGVEGPLPSGNCLGSCGQIDMHLRDQQDKINLAPRWTREMLARFFGVWNKWHLNDLAKREVPPDVLTFLATLPDADKSPAWV